jgi:hypothetical protein
MNTIITTMLLIYVIGMVALIRTNNSRFEKPHTYVSNRVFDGTRPITGKRLEALRKKRNKES